MEETAPVRPLCRKQVGKKQKKRLAAAIAALVSEQDDGLIYDSEVLHARADDLLIAELESLGYTAAVAAYRQLKRYF